MYGDTKGYDFSLNGNRLGRAGEHLDDRQRGVALVRLLLEDKRDIAVMLGLLPEGRRPGWWAGPLIEAGLRRRGAIT